jgi:hypothetical protein
MHESMLLAYFTINWVSNANLKRFIVMLNGDIPILPFSLTQKCYAPDRSLSSNKQELLSYCIESKVHLS